MRIPLHRPRGDPQSNAATRIFLAPIPTTPGPHVLPYAAPLCVEHSARLTAAQRVPAVPFTVLESAQQGQISQEHLTRRLEGEMLRVDARIHYY